MPIDRPAIPKRVVVDAVESAYLLLERPFL
jgi:hypothetical protein